MHIEIPSVGGCQSSQPLANRAGRLTLTPDTNTSTDTHKTYTHTHTRTHTAHKPIEYIYPWIDVKKYTMKFRNIKGNQTFEMKC